MSTMKTILLAMVAGINCNCFAVDMFTVNKVKGFEGFISSPKQDTNGLAIGYGTSLERAKKFGYVGGSITEQQASKYLISGLREEEIFLRKKIKNYDSLPSEVKTALLSMSYNSRQLIGPKLVNYVNNKNWKEVCNEIAYGHKTDKFGHVRRRNDEANLVARAVGLSNHYEAKSLSEWKSKKIANNR